MEYHLSVFRRQIDVFGESHPYTHLVPDLVGVDPDDAFSTVPYEKGCNLLVYLEQKLGGPGIRIFLLPQLGVVMLFTVMFAGWFSVRFSAPKNSFNKCHVTT